MRKRIIGVILGLLIIMTVAVIGSEGLQKSIQTNLNEEKKNKVISDFDFRVEELKNNGILIGNEKGDLQLGETLKRQEMVVLISRLMGKEVEAKGWNSEGLTFLDVEKNNWAAPYIAWAKDNNITKGYSEEWFGYDDTLTLEQTEIFLLRVLGYTEVTEDNVESLAYKSGLTSGIKNEENTEIIRSDVAIMLYNALYLEINETTLAETLGVKAKLTKEEKNLKINMEYYNVAFLRKIDIEDDWVFIYVNSAESTLDKKVENEYRAFILSIIGAVGYKNIKVIDNINNLEIVAYCNTEKHQVLAIEVDGVYNYFNMKETF